MAHQSKSPTCGMQAGLQSGKPVSRFTSYAGITQIRF